MSKSNENSLDKIEIEIDEQILKDIHEAAQKLNPEFMKLSKEDLRRVGESMSAAFNGFNRAPICFDSDSDCPMCEKGIPKDRILIIGTPSSAIHVPFAKLHAALAEIGDAARRIDSPVLGLHEDTIIIDSCNLVETEEGMKIGTSYSVGRGLGKSSLIAAVEEFDFKTQFMQEWEMTEPEDKPHHCHRKCKHQDRGFCLKKGGCNK